VTVTLVRYEAPGFGIGEVWLEGSRVMWSELPTPQISAKVGFWVQSPTVSRTPSSGQAPDGSAEASRGRSPNEGLIGRLAAFFVGADDDFADVELDFADGFYGDCQRALQGVRRGELVTYGELAALAGRPGAARAAGTFCARNRLAPFVPCHRVVGADGIGGYGSLGQDYKRRLLALEDVSL
jgi:methylated-DNA-[protein]-cysteine S-methyltransferase